MNQNDTKAYVRFPQAVNGLESADLDEQFEACDANGDQRIDFTEYSELLEELGSDIPPAQRRLRFDAIDLDRDGAINRQEFLDWLSA
jgi:Ca2+-binding EF-hand superfamily protein